jgi:type II secretory pathway pseudopilin PulG
MVIAVIGILASITFGISRGVQNAKASATAKAELASIAQALEQFKSVHGDYPWVDDEARELLKALLNWKKFQRVGVTTTFADKLAAENPTEGPRPFIDVSKLLLNGDLPDSPSTIPANSKSGEFTSNADDFGLIDPWGRTYVYSYKTTALGPWDNFGYVLYSRGEDGSHSPVSGNGILTTAIRQNADNADNIYVGQ